MDVGDRGPLDAAVGGTGATRRTARCYDTYRELIALRRKHPELADPRLDRFRVDEGGRLAGAAPRHPAGGW